MLDPFAVSSIICSKDRATSFGVAVASAVSIFMKRSEATDFGLLSFCCGITLLVTEAGCGVNTKADARLLG